MKITTDKEELNLNFQGDILICEKLHIDNNKNIEGKKTILSGANIFAFKLKKWRLRNVRHNLKVTYLLVETFWKYPKY